MRRAISVKVDRAAAAAAWQGMQVAQGEHQTHKGWFVFGLTFDCRGLRQAQGLVRVWFKYDF